MKGKITKILKVILAIFSSLSVVSASVIGVVSAVEHELSEKDCSQEVSEYD